MTRTVQVPLFDGARLTIEESIELTADSLRTYGARHPHWVIAWSGGKDSTTLLTVVLHLIESGQVERPAELTVLYADTRLELLPLWIAAQGIQAQLRAKDIEVRTVMAPLDKRMLVYMLGRGVPPPNNNTLRWCTRQIKVDPMQAEIARIAPVYEGKALVLTGVRQGESAIRDARIVMSCGRNGGECGQGWYQETLTNDRCNTLAPILHWRVCHVWDWLSYFAPAPEWGGWNTAGIAEAYGGDEAQEINARTGCVGCPLASKDTALDALLAQPQWAYLAPLKDLRPLWRELRLPQHRLRKPGGETRADGSLVANQHRMGPLTIDARRMALARVRDIQTRVNVAAWSFGRPTMDLLNEEEAARIERLISWNTWPQRWSGDEPIATEEFEEIAPDGSVQSVLWSALEEQP